MTRITRRRALTGLGGVGLMSLWSGSGLAQTASRSSRPVTIVVPYPAGGPTDLIARIAARALQAGLGSNVIVENQSGASGAIGSKRVARAEPNGATLLVSTNQTHATNISLLKDGGGYDPVKDFTVIGGLADLQHLVVTRADLQAQSVPDLIALARKSAAAGKALTCASTGIGSASHLTMELFKARTGVDFVHVPYRGAAPLLQDLVGKQVDVSFATVPTVLGQVQAGGIRALAIASPSRAPLLPDVPTLQQAGVSGVEADAWIAIFAPAALPDPIKESLRAVLAAAFTRSDVVQDIRAQGANPNWREPDAFATFQREDIQRWAAIIKAANISVE